MKKCVKSAMAMALALAAPAICRAGFTAGDLVVVTVGSGTNAAGTVTLNEYNVGGSLPATAIPHVLPSSGSLEFTLTGINDHDGLLRLTPDGQHLTLGGYRAAAGAADPTTSTAAVANRVIATVDGNWNIDTSTALTDAYNNTTIRAVAATNDLQFYTFGSGNYVDLNTGTTVQTTSGGLRYVSGVGATTSTNLSQTQTIGGTSTPDDIRGGSIAGGQVYITTGSSSSYPEKGAYRTATALPTSGAQTMIGVMTTSDTNNDHVTGSDDTNLPKSDMVLMDLDPTIPGYDTAYTTGGKKEYEKWSLIQETPGHYDWERISLKTSATAADIDALDATITGYTAGNVPIVDLYAATAAGVYRLTDSTGYDGAFSSAFPSTSLIPTVPSGVNLRGIAILGEVHAVPEPSAIVLALVALMPLIKRRTRAMRASA